VIGDIAWDVVMRPRGDLVWGSDVYGRVDLLPGGSSANVAVWAARLGAAVRLAGRVGDDLLGRLLRQHLRAEGLDADVVEAPGEPTPRIGVMIRADGEHAFVTDHSDPLRLRAADLPMTLLDGAGLVFLNGYSVFMAGSPDFAAPLLREARARGVAVAFDPSSFSLARRYGGRRLLEGIGPLDILLANEEEAAALLDEQAGGTPDRYAPLLASASLVVIKQGARGASTLTRDGLTHAPAPEVKVVDTMGAGDAFDAAFLTAWLAGAGPAEALARANRLGADVAGRLGAQTR
jgi:sugar/nucleoside kinase (ribokinase family)